jgi:hypothetical protein
VRVLFLALLSAFSQDRAAHIPVRGIPDKVISQLLRDVFGVLRIHTQQYNMCSSF